MKIILTICSSLLFLLFSALSFAQTSAVDAQTFIEFSNIPDARLRFNVLSLTGNKFLRLSNTKSLRLGLSFNNIGLAQKDTAKVKGTALAFGIPISLLNLRYNQSYFGVGVQYEYLTYYREKTYFETKKVQKDFAIKRINNHQFSAFLEYSPTVNTGFRIGYYFTNFFDDGVKENQTGIWHGISNSNIIYFSIRKSFICINCEDN